MKDLKRIRWKQEKIKYLAERFQKTIKTFGQKDSIVY